VLAAIESVNSGGQEKDMQIKASLATVNLEYRRDWRPTVGNPHNHFLLTIGIVSKFRLT
jgi:hypothetical protein